jgi:ureidoglycolate lyase
MSDTSVRVVQAEPLTSAGWAPFGEVVGRDECRMELRGETVFHLDVLTYEWRPLEADHLNRHHTATQALIPLGGAPAVVLVAPPEVDFSSADHLDALRAFVISGDVGINLALGTWHWGPYPLGERVALANVQGDVSHDNEVAHLGRDLGVTVQIRL